ncbi:MAG: aspartate/glutamate racemase family protein [Ilumatobacteraceae bacterium]
MRILVMNVNTTATMTETMRAAAAAVAAPGTEIVAAEPRFGPASVEGYYDSYISAAAILGRLATWDGPPFDALVWAGFGEHGREGAQELLDVPVITITEAAAMAACLVGHKYGVVTTLRRAIPQIEDQLRLAGLLDRCAAVLAADLGVLELEADGSRTAVRMVEVGREAIAAGAEALCLGCGGMAGMARHLSNELGVPVVDGVEAAVKLAESLHALGLRTSKINAFGAPLAKPRPGWPVSS